MYIYEEKSWPKFKWDEKKLTNLITKVSFAEGSLIATMKQLGFDFQMDSLLSNLTDEIIKSSEIEGEILNKEEVRSSIAKRLNIHNAKPVASSRHIDGIVEMIIDATHNYEKELSLKRLLSWHAVLFPTGYSGLYKIKVGKFRDDKNGPMRVISTKKTGGPEIIHYEAPSANLIKDYISDFLEWINKEDNTNPIIKAGIAHIWFVSIHPFEDGNGRITRAITDMMLARAENTPYRFYSMSAEIQKEKNKKEYYNILEKTQKGNLDITEWLEWFLQCLLSSIQNANKLTGKIINKAKLWQKYNKIALDERQKKILNMLMDNFEGNLTSSKMAKICKCSQDTATRSLKYLVEKNILEQQGDGRNTHYILKK